MGKVIICQPSEVWDLYMANKGPYLQQYEKEIAENPDYGAAIYLTEERTYPQIIVYLDDALVYEEICYTKDKCEQVANMVYEEYLTQKVLNHAGSYTPTVNAVTSSEKELDDEPDDHDAQADYELDETSKLLEIDAREQELQDAFLEFLSAVDDQEIYDPDMVVDTLDHVLEYMARKHGYTSIYRPMYLEDEAGKFFEECPYECMEYDDPDNPLYK